MNTTEIFEDILFDKDEKIISYLDSRRLQNTPEEAVRQRFVKFLVEDKGYPKALIDIEKQIKIGRESKRADIIIYKSEEAKVKNDQGQIFAIIETKAPDEKQPDGQFSSYLCATSAEGGIWTNGEKNVFLRKNSKGQIHEWIGFPDYNKSWDSIGKFTKSQLKIPVDLKNVFRRCHNSLYRSGIDSEDIALDMVRIILAKLEDENSSKKECSFYITNEESIDKDKTRHACERVRKLFESVKGRYPDVFSESEVISASDSQLALVIASIQDYNFLDAPHDVIGTAYEVYVASHLKGERGQYFTNRLVVQMMVSMLNPSDKSKILDPACRSAGFLVNAMDYVFAQIDSSGRTSSAKEILKRNVVHQLFGLDVSKKLVKIAKANMLLGKDGHGNIEQSNSLEDESKLSPNFTHLAGFGKIDVILTNPPFGSGDDVKVKDIGILKHYIVARRFERKGGKLVIGSDFNDGEGIPQEVLFCERCIQWLKYDGVLGIVMAKGQLDNKESLILRDFILKNCVILAVVNLHEDTFEPFCGSKASVIFLQKKKTIPKDYQIFMAISQKVGQTSRGEPIYKLDQNGAPLIISGKKVLDEDLSCISDKYKDFLNSRLKSTPFIFQINLSSLNKDSLSLNPVQYTPASNQAYKHILRIGSREDYELKTLNDVADKIFNGPRFKRPYANDGVTEGPGILKYYTGTALTQTNSDNLKYLDFNKANPIQKRQLEELKIYKGFILVSDSGTLGRISYALSCHDGTVATNNLIRIVIKDEYLRGYVYQYLRSQIGQTLLLKNAYGTNQEHLEPDDIKKIVIPIPKDKNLIKKIGKSVLAGIDFQEGLLQNASECDDGLNRILHLDITP